MDDQNQNSTQQPLTPSQGGQRVIQPLSESPQQPSPKVPAPVAQNVQPDNLNQNKNSTDPVTNNIEPNAKPMPSPSSIYPTPTSGLMADNTIKLNTEEVGNESTSKKFTFSKLVKYFIIFWLISLCLLFVKIGYNKFFATKVHSIQSSVVGNAYATRTVDAGGVMFSIKFDKSAYTTGPLGTTDVDLKGVDLSGNPMVLVLEPQTQAYSSTSSCSNSGYIQIGQVNVIGQQVAVCGFEASGGFVANNNVTVYFNYDMKGFALNLFMINKSQQVSLNTVSTIAQSVKPN